MTVKELSNALGVTTEQFFRNAYERFGRLYSIGGPQETHERYVKFGCIPIYVARYAREREKVLAAPVIDA